MNDAIDANSIQIIVVTPTVTCVASAGGNGVNPNRGAPKVHTNSLPDFCGDSVEYEEWARKEGAFIKRSICKHSLQEWLHQMTMCKLQGE